MKKIEKKFLEDYSNSMKSTKNFDDISKHIDYSKYKKEKKSFWNSKNLSILATSFAVILTISIVIPLTLRGNEPEGPSNPSDDNLVYTEYDAFIKDAFENNINNGPYLDMGGPRPQPPIVDDYFNKQEYNKPPMDYGKPDEGDGEILDNFTGRTYNYIYEVDYQNHDFNDLYACVYIEKKLAEKVYEENKEICDATPASPLNIVDGTIVDWFYSNSYYNESKVKWYNFSDKDTILSEIDGMVCCGVYLPQKRIITKEVLSQTKMHIVDELYSTMCFENNGDKYLTPIRYENNNITTWFALENELNESNMKTMFNSDYSCNLYCEIDKENDTIKVATYAIDLPNTSNSSLNEFYESANSCIVEVGDKISGAGRWVTYVYSEYVQYLIEFKKQ